MKRLPLYPLESRFFPWMIFGLFCAANSVLSYFTISLEWKFWIALIGLFLPALLAVRAVQGKRSSLNEALQGEWIPKIPLLAWILLALTALFLRFHQLTTLSEWPLEDEAMNGHYAIELAEKGAWQLTYDFSGMPPLYVWGLGLFFKIFGISLATLWFFPALLSTLAVGFVFAGARLLFSRSFTFLLTGFWAVSFWPLYLGRFSVQGGFLAGWMALTFYCLGIFLRAEGEKARLKSSWILGFCAGVGFYTFTSWSIVAFILTLFVFKLTVGARRGEWGKFLYFFIPEIILFLILAWTTLGDRGGHFRYVLQNPLGPGWTGLNDTCAMFWGSRLPPYLFAYRPFGGGFLNPLLGAFCFWGTVILARAGFSYWKQGIFFFILILPGFLTGGLDGHRVVQTMPFLIFTSSLGLASLASTLSQNKRIYFVAAMMLFSSLLDARQLFGVYHSLWTAPKDNWFASKSVERLRAFGILERLNKEQGPGAILSDLVPDIFDQSLSVATYPFNAAQNQKLSKVPCRWAAILINVHYQPYLSGQFPEASWFWLASDCVPPHGGLMLGVLPLPVSRPEVLNKYIEAEQASHSLTGQVYDNHDWKSSKPILQSLAGLYPLFKGEPFLESCFWEKIAEYDYHDREYSAQVQALQKALARGIPAAHLYNSLGALYMRRGYWEMARKNFQQAIHCGLNHTSAAAGLAALEELEKTGVKPNE